jgi:hypothetical protein
MTRVNALYRDEETGRVSSSWFDMDAAVCFPAKEGAQAGSDGHECLYVTAGGKFVFCYESTEFFVSGTLYVFINIENAIDWMRRMDYDPRLITGKEVAS